MFTDPARIAMCPYHVGVVLWLPSCSPLLPHGLHRPTWTHWCTECAAAGALAPNWTANPSLQKLTLANLTLPANTPLPTAWATAPSLAWLELEHLTGIVGGLPASWGSGMPALRVLMMVNMPWLTPTLANYVAFINQGTRGSMFEGIKLAGMGLQGTIPPQLFTATK